MNKFENLAIEDDILKGTYNSRLTGRITVEFDLEEEDTVMENFSGLISASETWIGKQFMYFRPHWYNPVS